LSHNNKNNKIRADLCDARKGFKPMRQIIIDTYAIDVIENGQRVLRLNRQDIQSVHCNHVQKGSSSFLGRTLGLKPIIIFESLVIMGEETSLKIQPDDPSLRPVMEWLSVDGWLIDEGVGRSFRQPDILTTITKG